MLRLQRLLDFLQGGLHRGQFCHQRLLDFQYRLIAHSFQRGTSAVVMAVVMVVRVVVRVVVVVVVVTSGSWQRRHRRFPVVKTEIQSIQLAFGSGQLQGEQGIPFLKAGRYSRFRITNCQLQFVVEFSRNSVQLFVNFLCFLDASTRR